MNARVFELFGGIKKELGGVLSVGAAAVAFAVGPPGVRHDLVEEAFVGGALPGVLAVGAQQIVAGNGVHEGRIERGGGVVRKGDFLRRLVGALHDGFANQVVVVLAHSVKGVGGLASNLALLIYFLLTKVENGPKEAQRADSCRVGIGNRFRRGR